MAILNLGRIIIGGTLVTSITIGAVSWTGTNDLATIKNKANHMKQTITDMSGNADSMVTKFNTFKSDVTAMLNDKIDQINSLQDQLGLSQANGTATKSDLDASVDEINRLNGELTSANTEVAQASSDVSTTDSDAQSIANGSKTSADMNTTLQLHIQNSGQTQQQSPQQPSLPTRTFNNLMDDMNSRGSVGMDYSADQWIKVEVSSGFYFKTNQQVIDYMTVQESQYDYPTGIKIKDQNGTVLYTTK